MDRHIARGPLGAVTVHPTLVEWAGSFCDFGPLLASMTRRHGPICVYGQGSDAESLRLDLVIRQVPTPTGFEIKAEIRSPRTGDRVLHSRCSVESSPWLVLADG